MWNAFTYLDWTTYFETLPADKIDLALRLEADRMVNSLFDAGRGRIGTHGDHFRARGQRKRAALPAGRGRPDAAFQVHPYQHEIIG